MCRISNNYSSKEHRKPGSHQQNEFSNIVDTIFLGSITKGLTASVSAFYDYSKIYALIWLKVGTQSNFIATISRKEIWCYSHPQSHFVNQFMLSNSS